MLDPGGKGLGLVFGLRVLTNVPRAGGTAEVSNRMIYELGALIDQIYRRISDTSMKPWFDRVE